MEAGTSVMGEITEQSGQSALYFLDPSIDGMPWMLPLRLSGFEQNRHLLPLAPVLLLPLRPLQLPPFCLEARHHHLASSLTYLRYYLPTTSPPSPLSRPSTLSTLAFFPPSRPTQDRSYLSSTRRHLFQSTSAPVPAAASASARFQHSVCLFRPSSVARLPATALARTTSGKRAYSLFHVSSRRPELSLLPCPALPCPQRCLSIASKEKGDENTHRQTSEQTSEQTKGVQSSTAPFSASFWPQFQVACSCRLSFRIAPAAAPNAPALVINDIKRSLNTKFAIKSPSLSTFCPHHLFPSRLKTRSLVFPTANRSCLVPDRRHNVTPAASFAIGSLSFWLLQFRCLDAKVLLRAV
ncbi:hypothetical protein J3F83DRAFT_350006 [Trichoderma novae-zelandiae]